MGSGFYNHSIMVEDTRISGVHWSDILANKWLCIKNQRQWAMEKKHLKSSFSLQTTHSCAHALAFACSHTHIDKCKHYTKYPKDSLGTEGFLLHLFISDTFFLVLVLTYFWSQQAPVTVGMGGTSALQKIKVQRPGQ